MKSLSRDYYLAFLALCILVLLPIQTGCSSKKEQSIAKIGNHEGSVEMRRSNNESFVDAQKGMELTIGAAIRTGSNGKVELIYLDDSSVSIRPDTYIEIGNDAHTVLQNKGKTLHRLKPHDPSRSVVTPHAVTSVLGTVFLVEATDENTRVWVEEGKVEVSNTAGNQQQIVEANFKVEVNIEGTVTEPERINPFVRQQLFNEGETRMPSINQN